MPPVVPPASATVVWALPTNFDDIRCLVWAEGEAGYRFAILYGEDTIETELAPNLYALGAVIELVWRGLVTSPGLRLDPPGPRRLPGETTQ